MQKVRLVVPPMTEPYVSGRTPAENTIAELRATLAPLLDQPVWETPGVPRVFGAVKCVFCSNAADRRSRRVQHADYCPALPANRDRLLGRS